MQFSTLFLAAAALLVPTQAFVAFSGDHCDGNAGANVPCDGSCHSFGGRHSFATGMASACVSMWTSGGCVGGRFNFSRQTESCTNVNTGTPIESFACFPTEYGCWA